ncbi:MAG: DsrE/DsrF/DrsH-like family protein [Candidatus Hydrothermarchaeales archaeon]
MVELKKVCIIASKGTLDMAYPPLMIATGAADMGAEVHLFFTFWGINIILKDKAEKLGISPVGKPEMPMPMPNILSVLPGMTPLATKMMKDQIKKSGIASIPKLIKMAHKAGVHFYACSPTMGMMKIKKEDLIPEVEKILGVAGFLDIAADSNITLFI